MKIFPVIFLLFFLSQVAHARIIHVPEGEKSIQAGINKAFYLKTGYRDTVLVSPGRYRESINFNGKNIVVGSLYLVTGDTSYISQTIIDGDSENVAVQFYLGEDTTAVLCGFTITNGYGGISGIR